MAKVLLILNHEESKNQCKKLEFMNNKRYMDIHVDEKLTLLFQMNDLPCLFCEQIKVEMNVEYKAFLQKHDALFKSSVECLSSKLVVKSNDLVASISKCLNCIGCKKDTCNFYEKLKSINGECAAASDATNPFQRVCASTALDPMFIDSNGDLRLKNECINPLLIYLLFYVHGADNLNKVFENDRNDLKKAKLNSRCIMHSLDKIRYKYVDVAGMWDIVSGDCMKQILTIHIDQLVDTMEKYLKKHRFCCDCRAKIWHAFDILTGVAIVVDDKRYLPSLYEGFKCCDKHIHINCEKELVSMLIKNAESEVNASKSERHAQTIDTAQEEVVKCIGIHLSEMFHKISLAVASEERAWRLLFYVGVSKLKECFETEFQKLNGKQDLKSILSEFDAIDEKKKTNEKEKRKSQVKKRSNKKQAKEANKLENEQQEDNSEGNNKEEIDYDSNDVVKTCECKVESLNLNDDECANNIKLSWDTKVDAIIQSDSTDIDNYNSLKDCLCRSTSPVNIISYWQHIQNSPSIDNEVIDERLKITDEEKREYFKNKKQYVKRLKAHRRKLVENFQDKMISQIVLKPRLMTIADECQVSSE